MSTHSRESLTFAAKEVLPLDLSEVEMLDGGGIGMLVFLHNWTRVKGIQLKLVNPSSLAREMLMRTRLTSVLHVSSMDDVVERAAHSFRIERKGDVLLTGRKYITEPGPRFFGIPSPY
jgi:anti-anti-sigma regulatory factor